jgi:hypothetical protein
MTDEGDGPGTDGPGTEGPGIRKSQRRRKVVLAEAKGAHTVARTIVELEEQTSVGEHLVRSLVRAQLRNALTMAVLTIVALAGLPLLFYLFPEFGAFTVLGVRLPWVLLGVAPYPLIYGIGVWYVRRAERHERDFVNMVDR